MNLKNKIFNFFSKTELKKEIQTELDLKLEEIETDVNIRFQASKADLIENFNKKLEDLKTELKADLDKKLEELKTVADPVIESEPKKFDLKSELHEVIENKSYVLYYIDKDKKVLINCNIVPEEEPLFARMMYEINSGDYEDSFIELCPNQIVIGAYLDYINLEEDPVIHPFQAFQGKR